MNSIAIILIVVSVIAFIILGLKMSTTKKQKKVVEEVKEVKPDKTEETINAIVNTNLALRTKCSDKEIIEKVETLINELIKVVELVNEEDNYTQNTPLINRMGVKYLPSYVNTYLNLEASVQAKRKDSFIEGLTTLNETIVKSRKTIENEDTAEFTKQMGFVNAFFEKDYNGGN